jgi:hypothetical protein
MSVKYMKEKAIEVDWRKLLLDALKLVSSLGMIRVPPTKAYCNFDLTNVKYNTYKQSREENLKVMEQMRPSSLIHSENLKSRY